MAVKIGHAFGDENGKSKGGAAGDQTGKEIRTQNWYNRSGGWEVYLECTDKTMAKKAANFCQAICDSPNFGYDQSQRWTGLEAIKNAGNVVANAKPSEFDCSSLVDTCYMLSGLKIKKGYTGDLEKRYLATGKFKAHREKDYLTSANFASIGGIYLTSGAHVAMVLSNGPKYKSTTNESTNTTNSSNNISNDGKYVEIVISGGHVHVRKSPKTGTPIYITKSKGEKLTYIDTDPDTGWYLVQTSKGQGYITNNKKYVNLVE